MRKVTFNRVEDISFKNVSSTQGPFHRHLRRRLCHPTAIGPRWLNLRDVLTAFSASGFSSANLPAGTYQLAIATATAVYADVVGIVTTM
jgi:hypothetical protein